MDRTCPPPLVARSKLAAVLTILTSFVVSACDGDPTGSTLERGNVDFQLGALATDSDSGVVVGGRLVIRHPSNHKAVWVDRFDHYDFGGFPEHDYIQSTRHSLSWRIGFRHGHPPVEQGDSLIFSFVDHGDVVLEAEPMDKFEDLPHVGPTTPVRFENFISYMARPYVRVDWWDGGRHTFEHASYFDDMIAGSALTLETSGSDEVHPLAASFSVTPFAELVGLRSGEPIPLDADMPVVRVDEPLELEFDQPLDPARAFIALIAFRGNEGHRAFVQPRVPAERVVIPAEALRDLVAGSEVERIAYRLFVIEVRSQEGAIEGAFRDGGETFSIPFVQRSETGVHLYLER